MLAYFFVTFLLSFLSTPAFGQGVVLSNGDIVGTVRVGAMCASGSRTCITIKNDSPVYPMEVESVSYFSASGQVFIVSPPVIDGLLQCVLPEDRPCVPVLTPGQQGAMRLLEPPENGQLIVIRLRLWTTPGCEACLREENILPGGVRVFIVGDRAASRQAPSKVAEERVVKIGTFSWLADWAKGTKY